MKVYTTSNLVNHLRNHSEEYKKYEVMKVAVKEKEAASSQDDKQTTSESRLKQVALPQAEDMRKVWDINDHQAKAVHIKIAEMIAQDCQPYPVVGDIGFGALIHVLEPRYNIPS